MNAFVKESGLALLLIGGGGCSSRTSADGTGPGEGPIHVTGRLLDAETGRPVSRKRIWVHGFNDALPDPAIRGGKVKRSLAPDDATTFELNLLVPAVRLRVADQSNEYELFEQNFEVSSGTLDLDVRLKPSHWVRLHGRVFWRDHGALKPFVPSHGEWLENAITFSRGGGVDPDDEGNYSCLAPRELLKVLVISSERRVSPREVDLRGERGDDHVQDFVFEE